MDHPHFTLGLLDRDPLLARVCVQLVAGDPVLLGELHLALGDALIRFRELLSLLGLLLCRQIFINFGPGLGGVIMLRDRAILVLKRPLGLLLVDLILVALSIVQLAPCILEDAIEIGTLRSLLEPGQYKENGKG